MTDDLTLEARDVPLGGVRGLNVYRTLPSREIPTIGAWCFVDHFGPTTQVMEVLPHPHTGLQTVTWPMAGEIRHRDNLGSDVVLRPGELNLMTSGDGVSHSEFSVIDENEPPAHMHGVQLWVALPDGRRAGIAGFEHHPDLPTVRAERWSATVLIGDFAGESSKATVHTPLVGAQIQLEAGTHSLPLNPEFEHGLLAVDGSLELVGATLNHRDLRYLAPGKAQVDVTVDSSRTVLLIGGAPFEEEIVMWWNFIGRSHEEIVQARQDWQAQTSRFGHVDGSEGRIIPAPPMPDLRLRPRVRRPTR